jgi:hypothetical protein
MSEDDLTKEYLEGVRKDMSEVGVLLKAAPTKEDIEALKIDMADIKKSAGTDDVAEIVKAAIAEAVKPFEKRIAELEDSPVVKGMQDFDLAKFKKAAATPAEPEKIDVAGSIIKMSYPEVMKGRN